MMYKDMLKKLKFHKENVIKDLLMQGIYPEDSLVETTINSLDSRLALFKKYTFMPGTAVNILELNNCLEMIYKDLEILYSILIEIYTNDFSKLSTYVESHLSELEATVDKYEKRAKEETNSTTFGRTIYFETNSFDIETNDDKTTINLGKIDLISGSTIACFANLNNTLSEDISFDFKTSEDDKSFNTLAYNYNNSKIKVPGELTINKYDLELNKDFIITDTVKLNIKNLNANNEYKIMGGKGYVLIKNLENLSEKIIPLPSFESNYRVDYDAHVSFYLVDGDSFEYRFNTRPIHTNFSLNNSTVKVTSENKNVFMEVPKGFTFGISVKSGDVFAVKENGIIKDNSLYYYGNKDINNVQVREHIRDNKITYNATVTIKTEEISNIDIDSIYIKELY